MSRASRLVFATSLLVGSGASIGRAAAPSCEGHRATIVGTVMPEHLRGTPGNDVIVGGFGADVITGRGGNDIICGGGGNDRLVGGAGNDQLFGGSGDDAMMGGVGQDLQNGGPGNDVDETDGDDTVENDDGHDLVECADGGDGSQCQDETARSLLYHGGEVAETYADSNEDSFSGFDAAAAGALAHTITWQDGGTSAEGVVAIKDVAADHVLLTTQSSSGEYLCVAENLDGDDGWAQGAADFDTAAGCTGGDDGDGG